MPTPDLLEDILAFLHATEEKQSSQGDSANCPICGEELTEGDDGELCCSDCGESD